MSQQQKQHRKKSRKHNESSEIEDVFKEFTQESINMFSGVFGMSLQEATNARKS